MVDHLPALDPDDAHVRSHHLLALPPDVAPDELEVLAVSRFGRASWEQAEPDAKPRTGILPAVTAALGIRKVAPVMPRLRLGHRSALVGPYRLTAVSAVALGLPATSDTAWVVDGQRERGEPPFAGVGDRDGLGRAFPDGLPVREEERVVRWMIAAARRLGGAVRVGDNGVVLTPDPDAAVDLSLLTTRWPSGQEVLAQVRRVMPRARMAGDYEHPWSFDPHITGATPQVQPAPRPGRHLRGARPLGRTFEAARGVFARHGSDEPGRGPQIRAEVEALDELMSGQSDLWGVEVDLGLDGVIEVVPEPLEEPPIVLRAAPWAAAGLIALRVRWHPHEGEQLHYERPSASHRVARGRAAPMVNEVAVALWDAFDGEIADEAEFLIDAADLRRGSR